LGLRILFIDLQNKHLLICNLPKIKLKKNHLKTYTKIWHKWHGRGKMVRAILSSAKFEGKKVPDLFFSRTNESSVVIIRKKSCSKMTH